MNLRSKLGQKGVALLFVVMFAAVLMVIALGLTTLVTSEIRQVSDVQDSTQAFYSAESGIEFGLRFTTKGGTIANPAAPGQTCNDIYNASSVVDNYTNGPVTWQNLEGITVHKQSTNQYFMRITAIGVSNGIRRTESVDFTPSCLWSYSPSSPGWTGQAWGRRSNNPINE